MLKIGDEAPSFSLQTDTGAQVSLSDFAGKTVVLYFYPKDDTPGCTKEACDFRDRQAQYDELNTVILGISPDTETAHRAFKTKYQLPFTLLVDIEHQIAERYGVWQEKTSYGRIFMGIERTTFIIGKDQKIVAIFNRVQVEGHTDHILKVLKGEAPAPGKTMQDLGAVSVPSKSVQKPAQMAKSGSVKANVVKAAQAKTLAVAADKTAKLRTEIKSKQAVQTAVVKATTAGKKLIESKNKSKTKVETKQVMAKTTTKAATKATKSSTKSSKTPTKAAKTVKVAAAKTAKKTTVAKKPTAKKVVEKKASAKKTVGAATKKAATVKKLDSKAGAAKKATTKKPAAKKPAKTSTKKT